MTEINSVSQTALAYQNPVSMQVAASTQGKEPVHPSFFSLESNLTRAKHVLGGIAATALTVTKGVSAGYIGKFFKIIPDDDCFFWKDYHKMLQESTNLNIPSFEAWKLMVPAALIGGGIGEELIFRGLIQDLILKRLVGKTIEKISPEHASWIDTNAAKVMRITLASGLFAATHLITMSEEIPLGIKWQAFSAFTSGLILGAIKESRLGLKGSIACHMTHNAIGMTDIYYSCIPRS